MMTTGYNLKVIGAGLSRTGTNSLRNALDMIGLPCYHGFVSFEQRQRDNKFWLDAIAKDGNINWNELFYEHNYEAVCDVPAVFYWKSIYNFYPNSRVILTKRDPIKWYNSLQKNMKPIVHTNVFFNPMISLIYKFVPGGNEFQQVYNEMYRRNIGEFKMKNTEKNIYIDFFNEWNNNVIQHFDDTKQRDKLLIIDIDQKVDPKIRLEELMDFLQIDPNNLLNLIKEYPNTNSKQEMDRYVTDVFKQMITGKLYKC
eukprot:183703_1